MLIIAAAIIVLISRLSFISAGYGADVDAWRVVAVARDMTETGDFVYSRVPGHPLHELICTLIWDKGPLWMNGFTAVMSVIAAVFFMLILNRLGFKNIFLPALAFAFTPVIFINSVNALEHIWALAFIMGSMYFAIDNKPLAAGILLGLADGCRLPSILLLVPFALILYFNSGKKLKTFMQFAAAVFGVTLILFLPLFLKFDLFNVYKGSYPDVIYIAFRMFIATWGFIGLAAILTVCAVEFIYRIKSRNDNASHISKKDRYFDASLWAGIILFAISFLLLPHKAAYLIPTVPLVLILLGKFLNPRLFNAVCISLVISPFLLGVNRTDLDVLPDFSQYSARFTTKGGEIVFDLLNGPVLSEHSKRLNQLEFTAKIISETGRLERKSVVVVGESFPLIDVTLPHNHQGDVIIQGNTIYEYFLDSSKVKRYSTGEFDIYYLPNIDEYNLELHSLDLKDHGAKNLLEKR